MPIEIRELVIRAVVEPQPREMDIEAVAIAEEERARLIQKCVDEVLKALRRERER